MMNERKSAEIARIRAAYDRYAQSSMKREAWSTENPGNRYILEERQRAVDELLQAYGLPLGNAKRVLEIGCGSGDVLASMSRFELPDAALHGTELLEDRIRIAHLHHPKLRLSCADGSQLPYRDSTFAVVMFFTVFTSILDDALALQIAAEADRILEPGGKVLWYDFRYSNPRNPAVRPMKVSDIRTLFPGYVLRLRSLTLLPPLARRLGWWTSMLYPCLSFVPLLRTHYCGILTKPGHY